MALKAIASGVVVAALIIAGCFWWLHRDPLNVLPKAEHHLGATRGELPPLHKRHVEHITLHSANLGDIGFVVSLPDPLPAEKLPLLIVLGGLGTGENNIRTIDNAGNNAIIGYDWPMPVHFYGGTRLILQMPDLYGRLTSIPAQVASGIDWLSEQSWADPQRVSLLGFSLGALAAPGIQDVAQEDGQKIGWTILAYGGAPLGDLFAINPHMKPVLLRKTLAPLIDFLLAPLQPARHLPRLSGHFLVLEGRNDQLMPDINRQLLRDAVPEPKTVVTFDGNHMGVGDDKMELLNKIIFTSESWLRDQGAVNAPR